MQFEHTMSCHLMVYNVELLEHLENYFCVCTLASSQKSMFNLIFQRNNEFLKIDVIFTYHTGGDTFIWRGAVVARGW